MIELAYASIAQHEEQRVQRLEGAEATAVSVAMSAHGDALESPNDYIVVVTRIRVGFRVAILKKIVQENGVIRFRNGPGFGETFEIDPSGQLLRRYPSMRPA